MPIPELHFCSDEEDLQLLSSSNYCFSNQQGNILLDGFDYAFLKVNHRPHVYLTA